MDLYSMLSTIPWVIAHPWLLAIVLPAVFWFIGHTWANIPPPTDTSNVLWKAVYPVINTVIAANYKYSENKLQPVTTIDTPKGDVPHA